LLLPQTSRPHSIYPTSSRYLLTGGLPCTFVPPLICNITQDAARPTQLRYSQECSYSWSYRALSIRQMLSMLDVHLLRNLVPRPQDDIAMHLPVQTLAKPSDLTYPKQGKTTLAQGAGCRSGRLSGLRALTRLLSSGAKILRSCCALTSELRQAQSEYEI
jgi:hypothetical protein